MPKRKLLIWSLICLPIAACGVGADNRVDGDAANGQAAEEKAEVDRRNIGEALEGSGDHAAFVGALKSAGLFEIFSGAGPYTVFAPAESAFQAVPEDVRRRLQAPEQRERAISLLSYHVVPGAVTAADINRAIDRAPEGRAELATVTGTNLTLSREGEAILISDGAGGQARITRPDQLFSNGVVHSIDTVLMPSG